MSPKAPPPLITVVIPLYNGAEFIERSLRSVMAQTYGNLEILVVDDGSTDNSAQLVEVLRREDDRIRLIPKPNGGVASARNLGIQRARGAWIGFVDADDIWDPTFMQKVVDRTVFLSDSVGVIYSWAQNINGGDQPMPGVHVAAITGNVYGTLLCHNFLGNASATVIRRSCLDRVGGYDIGLRAAQAQGCEDWDLYLRLAEYYDYAVIPELLVGYRKLENSMSGDGHTMAKSQGLMLDKVRSRHPEIPDWYYGLSRSSFYLYLASQGQQYGQVETMDYWRRQAKLAHPWATVLRPDWHRLKSRPRPQSPIKATNPQNGLRFWASLWAKVVLTQVIHYGLILFSKMIGLKRSPQP
jgi:glycosyltransferase involved in cell wall biosynthesis